MPISYIPGPSQPYPKLAEFVQDALAAQIPSLSHRSRPFSNLYNDTAGALRQLMGVPADYEVWFLSSATEAMERILQNTVGTASHHVVTGAFAERFAHMGEELGLTITQSRTKWGSGVKLDGLEIPPAAELIALTHNETSTGVALDPAAIHRLRRRNPRPLIAVDLVSCAPFSGLSIADVDLAFFSVQKGFGLPAGLGVLLASPRALAKANALRAAGRSIGTYHAFPELAAFAARGHTPETPNVLGIYLLNRVAHDLLARDPVRLEAQLKAQAAALYAALENHPHIAPFVTNPADRSTSVIIASVQGEQNSPLLSDLSAQGHQLGAGYAHYKTSQIRIANFPAHLGATASLITALNQWHP